MAGIALQQPNCCQVILRHHAKETFEEGFQEGQRGNLVNVSGKYFLNTRSLGGVVGWRGHEGGKENIKVFLLKNKANDEA